MTQLEHPGKGWQILRETILAYIFILPAVIITFMFGIYPVVLGLWESFKAGAPLPTNYVGVDQYIRSVGSLIYVIILVLCVIFLSLALKNWQRLRDPETPTAEDAVWGYLIPAFITALTSIAIIGLLVTKGYVHPIMDGVSIIWVPIGIFVVGAIGTYWVSQRNQSTKRHNYVLNTWLLMILTILPILMVRYAYGQLKGDVENARRVAALVLNTEVGNAQPLRTVEGGTYADVEIGDVPVNVTIGDETYEAVLAADFYRQITLDKVSEQSSINFTNNQKVQVLIPLLRGFGFDPIPYQVEASLVLERSAANIGGSTPTLEVPITIDQSQLRAPYDIFFTGDVGTNVVARGGYTPPIDRPFQAAIGVLAGLLGVYVIGGFRQQIAGEEGKQRLHTWLGVGRSVAWIVVIGLAAYVASQIIFYREAALGIQRLSQEQLRVAYEFAAGRPAPANLFRDRVAQQLMFFPQVVSISAGALLIGAAYMTWIGAKDRETGAGMSGSLVFSIMLMIGGWLCISELPNTIMLGGDNAIQARDAMVRTAMYSLGTVPAQLAIGMLLAYLMFYEVSTGKGLFRLFYFMPYITPQVATATVFTVIFGIRASSLANKFLGVFGIGDQKWLQEGQGVIRIFYAEVFNGNPDHIPALFQGPSLALVAIILFNIWVYAGYNSVIFLAGLGAIPGELYEAARVDGAGRWSAFRHITFPLLSPVTFFLSILSVIGTFKAFGSVYVLKNPDNNYADTFTIRIFDALFRDNERGYAAALAFVLFGVIMVLTMVQNRLSRERVFYG